MGSTGAFRSAVSTEGEHDMVNRNRTILLTARSFGATSSEPAQLLERHGCDLVRCPGPFKERELIDLVKDVDPDGMIVGADEVSARVIEHARRLKVICQHGVGVDAIDLGAAKKKGVMVANVPGANADAVAELTWALILCLARDVVRADQAVKNGEFPVFVGRSVCRKTLGIVGLGSIGKAVARRAFGFDMSILAYDTIQDEQYAERWGIKYTTLEEVLACSDYVTVHLPLTSETIGLITAEKLGLMKPDGYLINMSRGGIVDEAAVAQFVREHKLAGAAADVFAQEPPQADNPLLTSGSCIITTPHMGGRTVETLTAVSLRAAEAVIGVLNGCLEGVHIVNM